MTGFAQGTKVTEALEQVGIHPSAFTWRWRPGVEGGVYPPHLAQNGDTKKDPGDFEALPQHDLNGEYCECQIQTVWRDDRERFAPEPTKAALAHLHMPEILPSPQLMQLMNQMASKLQEFAAVNPVIEVKVPEIKAPDVIVNVPAPVVRVEAPQVHLTPVIPPAAPTPVEVHVDAPVLPAPVVEIDVAAPIVTVEPAVIPPAEVNVEVQSAVAVPDVQVRPVINLPEPKLPKQFRVLRDSAGKITGSEEVK